MWWLWWIEIGQSFHRTNGRTDGQTVAYEKIVWMPLIQAASHLKWVANSIFPSDLCKWQPKNQCGWSRYRLECDQQMGSGHNVASLVDRRVKRVWHTSHRAFAKQLFQRTDLFQIIFDRIDGSAMWWLCSCACCASQPTGSYHSTTMIRSCLRLMISGCRARNWIATTVSRTENLDASWNEWRLGVIWIFCLNQVRPKARRLLCIIHSNPAWMRGVVQWWTMAGILSDVRLVFRWFRLCLGRRPIVSFSSIITGRLPTNHFGSCEMWEWLTSFEAWDAGRESIVKRYEIRTRS